MRERHPLDNPARSALLGPHAHLAQRRGPVLRYPEDVSPFGALPDELEDAAWQAAAELIGSDSVMAVAGLSGHPPEDWEVVFRLPGVQLVDAGVAATEDPEAVELGPADVPEMIALVERTRPGPFRARTIEMGRYLGIRSGGALVAMAGERMDPPGWIEISAVCTDAAFRGRGLAGRLVSAVVAGIRDRGEVPFLHTTADNAGALRLYEAMGFQLRRKIDFIGLRLPPG